MKYLIEFTDTGSRLEEFPLSSAIPKDRTLVSAGYRFLIHKEYLIFYFIDEKKAKIYVSAIFNAKKDYTRVLKKLI